MLEMELQTIQKLMEDEAADREYERACMMERIQQLEESIFVLTFDMFYIQWSVNLFLTCTWIYLNIIKI
jgi:hypothetical protein